jgi:hypothetical protein
MTYFRSVILAVSLGVVALFVAIEGSAQSREPANPAADIVNPWAAGDAAVQRLLDDCVAVRGKGSDRDPSTVYSLVITRRPACGVFPPSRILAASPAWDE